MTDDARYYRLLAAHLIWRARRLYIAGVYTRSVFLDVVFAVVSVLDAK